MRPDGVLRRLCGCVWLVCVVAVPAAANSPLAVYHADRGWATFGLALAQGSARDAVALGGAPTQTDVKTTWPDGSIRFAVITARIDRAGHYSIVQTSRQTGRAVTGWPAASVEFVTAGRRWTAQLPSAPSRDQWLAGPLVTESRVVAHPASVDNTHPLLQVIFDVRAYADGGFRLDVTVENVLNVPTADAVNYDVTVTIGDDVVFRKTAVRHGYLTRWRRMFNVGLDDTIIRPDFEPLYASRAVPRYLSDIPNPSATLAGKTFEILTVGDLNPAMASAGGRPEIGPYPAWVSQYLVHRSPALRDYVLRHGDIAAGAWPIHIREADGASLVSLDAKPLFWIDYYGPPRYPRDGGVSGPANGMAGLPDGLWPDTAHQPSLAYVPYLLTGDRFFLDEMKFWANFALLASYPHDRAGQGRIMRGEVRAIGWSIRQIADAAAYTPDTDPAKEYFSRYLMHTLTALQEHASTDMSPLETLFVGDPYLVGDAYRTRMMPWQNAYVAWALDHARDLGYDAGMTTRDKIIRFQIGLFTNDPQYSRRYATPFLLSTGVVERPSDSKIRFFGSWDELFRGNYGGSPPLPPDPWTPIGSYGVEARLVLLMGVRERLAEADTALGYLMSVTHPSNPRYSMADDVRERSQWAVAE